MPVPLAIPALGAIGAKLGGALTALKGGLGVAKGMSAAKAGMGAYKSLAGAGVPKAVARFAGDKIMKIGRGFTPGGFAKNLGIPMSKGDIAMTVAPDLLFGGITAATTEGDIGDKLIAGTGSAVGGIAGGIGGRGLLGPKSGLGILGTEMVGGMIGDQIGYGAAENLIRMKGGGMTPQEKKMREAEALQKQQLMQELGLM